KVFSSAANSLDSSGCQEGGKYRNALRTANFFSSSESISLRLGALLAFFGYGFLGGSSLGMPCSIWTLKLVFMAKNFCRLLLCDYFSVFPYFGGEQHPLLVQDFL